MCSICIGIVSPSLDSFDIICPYLQQSGRMILGINARTITLIKQIMKNA